MLDSISDLINAFPSGTVNTEKTETEWASPCPFCTEDTEGAPTYIHNGVAFFGDDRLIWYKNTNGFYCRRCNAAQRGGTSRKNGYYTILHLAEKLGETLSSDFDTETPAATQRATPLTILWGETKILHAHKSVDRNYWKQKTGWTDEVIDRFKLGKGMLYSKDGSVHLIPMKVSRLDDDGLFEYDSYYISGRKEGLPAKRTPGSSRFHFWEIEE